MVTAIKSAIHKLEDDKIAEVTIISIVVAAILWAKVNPILAIGEMIDLEPEVVFVFAIIP
jgi:hypothetical protein